MPCLQLHCLQCNMSSKNCKVLTKIKSFGPNTSIFTAAHCPTLSLRHKHPDNISQDITSVEVKPEEVQHIKFPNIDARSGNRTFLLCQLKECILSQDKQWLLVALL